MVLFTSEDNARSGVPHGGIGAGKFEFLPNGLVNAVSLLNNWSSPLEGTQLYNGILGFHFGVSAQPCKSAGQQHPEKKAFLLQTAAVSNIPRVKKIEYEGEFPAARLRYLESSLDMEVSLELCSGFVPGDVLDSSLPACYGKFTVRNLRDCAVDAGLLFIGRNICGQWCVGRRNRIEEDARLVHLEFSNPDPARRDPMAGQMRFSFEKKGWNLSYLESWNSVTRNFHYTSQDIFLAAWEPFVKEGRLSNLRDSGYIARGENQELCGAVSAATRLEAGQTRQWPWMVTWHFPDHAIGGHAYARRFRRASEVTVYAAAKSKRILARTSRFQALVKQLPFPQWFNQSLLESLAPFYSSTVSLKDGRAAFFEAPVICPLMGTVDVGYYGSIPLSYFFPQLEKAQLWEFAKAQRPGGYIPHDLGRMRLDMPSNGTTFYLWKDLNPKFILMAYRDYLWSGDLAFLKKLYPVIKRALAWTLTTDKDHNGLPDNEGADQTFDLWTHKGTSAYTSSIYLAALLACRRIAVVLHDVVFERQCKEFFVKGRRSFEKELWNGEYFGDACSLSQLNGQWYADLLGLGSIVDDNKIQKALKSIVKRNTTHSRFGMVNSVLFDGCLDNSNDHSKNIWAGMNYAFISLCIMRGLPIKILMDQAKKIWDNISRLQQNTWNLPDTIDSQTGRYIFGDGYYRNLSIWSIPIAHGMADCRTKKLLDQMRSPE